MAKTGIHSPAVQYQYGLNFLNMLGSDEWEERFILALMANNLKLAAQPTEPYHVMAPVPRREAVITWPANTYIVERTPSK